MGESIWSAAAMPYRKDLLVVKGISFCMNEKGKSVHICVQMNLIGCLLNNKSD